MVVNKIWGKYEDIHRTDQIVVKLLTIEKGKKISNQMHKSRNEKWHIVSGFGEAILQEGDSIVHLGLSRHSRFNVPIETWHQVKADDDFDLVIVEVQTGVCSEEDILRKEDVL